MTVITHLKSSVCLRAPSSFLSVSKMKSPSLWRLAILESLYTSSCLTFNLSMVSLSSPDGALVDPRLSSSTDVSRNLAALLHPHMNGSSLCNDLINGKYIYIYIYRNRRIRKERNSNNKEKTGILIEGGILIRLWQRNRISRIRAEMWGEMAKTEQRNNNYSTKKNVHTWDLHYLIKKLE